MGVNNIKINGETVLDLMSDTVTAETLLKGYTAHNKSGNKITGALSPVTYYTGTSEPTSATGSDGDLYLVVEG